MNEFDSFFVYVSEVIYDMDQDRENLQEFRASAKRHLGRLNTSLTRMKNRKKIKAARSNIRETKRYIVRIEKEIKLIERKLKKLQRFSEEIKKIKLVVMSRVGEEKECRSMNSCVRTARTKSKKYSPQKKPKKGKSSHARSVVKE
jgi:hypothetical protein